MVVVVREVYHHNLESEFEFIRQSLPRFPFVSMDTEFPGTVHDPDEGVPAHLRSTLSPTEFYKVMKKNVDDLKLIQVGLTLSDAHGNLPTSRDGTQFVWEFNFKDFDDENDLQNKDSISLLKRQGIDFRRNKSCGIASSLFCANWPAPGSIYNNRWCVKWVTFHGSYDFGFLIKVLTGKQLPDDLDGFLKLVRKYFGPQVYDVKNMIRLFGLDGGLDRVAKSLGVNRVAGKSHQAGSDSLLTMHVYLDLINKRINSFEQLERIWRLNHMVYGLTTVS